MNFPFPFEHLPSTNPPTCYGWVHDARAALAIIKLVVIGVLPFTVERVPEAERHALISSGNVFVVKESEVQRWTDGRRWSPSRAYEQFMMYREVENRLPVRRPEPDPARSRTSHSSLDEIIYGPLGHGFEFKPGGLMKKTFCAVNMKTGETFRLISYYNPEDLKRRMLPVFDESMLLPCIPNPHDERICQIEAKVRLESGKVNPQFQQVTPPPNPRRRPPMPEMGVDPAALHNNYLQDPDPLPRYYRPF